MMLGNFDGKNFESPPWVGIVIIGFMIMLCIVTENVLTALSVNQVDYNMKNADLTRVEKMAAVCQSPYLSELDFFPSLKPTGYFCQFHG